MALLRMLSKQRTLLGQVLTRLIKGNDPVIPSRKSNNPASRPISHLAIDHETLEERICRYECIFGREDADGWDVRQAINDLTGYDSVPEPRIIIAGLHACRRINDYALSMRFLEMVKDKCGNNVKEIYPYIVQEVGPTVAELGCDFPENLGYDKPELWLQSAHEM